MELKCVVQNGSQNLTEMEKTVKSKYGWSRLEELFSLGCGVGPTVFIKDTDHNVL